MRPPQPPEPEERTRRILDAAASAFHDKGFHGVGVDELGRRAGLSGPALYRHFSGKDEILATLLDQAMDELLSATTPVEEDPWADLQRALRHHVRFAIDNRVLVGLYHREARALVNPWFSAFARRAGQYTRRWEQLVARGLPGTPAPVVAAATQACLGMIFSVPGWPHRSLEGDLDLEELLLRLLTAGLPALGRGGREDTAPDGD